MSKRFYLINFFLILIIVFLSVKNYKEWTHPSPKGKEATAQKQKTNVSSASASMVGLVGGKEIPSPANFKQISDKNIFNPERKEYPVPLTPSDVKKPVVRPNIMLYGVAIGGEFHSAVVNNPGRRIDKGERETMTVMVGDKVGEYTVAKILEDRITMETAEDSFDVLLYDPSRQKKRPVVPMGPTRITPSAPPTPAPILPPASSVPPPRPFTRAPAGTSPPPLITPPPAGMVPLSPPSTPSPVPERNLIRGRRGLTVPSGTPAGPSAEQVDEDEEN